MRGVDALIRSETKRLEELKYQHAAAKKEGEALEQEIRERGALSVDELGLDDWTCLAAWDLSYLTLQNKKTSRL